MDTITPIDLTPALCKYRQAQNPAAVSFRDLYLRGGWSLILEKLKAEGAPEPSESYWLLERVIGHKGPFDLVPALIGAVAGQEASLLQATAIHGRFDIAEALVAKIDDHQLIAWEVLKTALEKSPSFLRCLLEKFPMLIDRKELFFTENLSTASGSAKEYLVERALNRESSPPGALPLVMELAGERTLEFIGKINLETTDVGVAFKVLNAAMLSKNLAYVRAILEKKGIEALFAADSLEPNHTPQRLAFEAAKYPENTEVLEALYAKVRPQHQQAFLKKALSVAKDAVTVAWVLDKKLLTEQTLAQEFASALSDDLTLPYAKIILRGQPNLVSSKHTTDALFSSGNLDLLQLQQGTLKALRSAKELGIKIPLFVEDGTGETKNILEHILTCKRPNSDDLIVDAEILDYVVSELRVESSGTTVAENPRHATVTALVAAFDKANAAATT